MRFLRRFQIRQIIFQLHATACYAFLDMRLPFLNQNRLMFLFSVAASVKSRLMRFCLMIRGLLRACLSSSYEGVNIRKTIKSD